MPKPGDTGLPRHIELLWGLDEPGGRGPKRGLSLDRLLEAAIEVADAEGFEGLSMAAVAKRLGFTTMSLYRYVDSKSTLMELLLDRVIGESPKIEPGTPWRAALEQWARAEHEAITRHPWWLDLPWTGPPMGPNNLAWLETALSTLGSTGLPEPVKLQLVLNLSFYVVGRMRTARGMLSNSDDATDEAVLARVVDVSRFPAFTAALSARAFDQDDVDWTDFDFEFGLARMLDGYETYIRSFAKE